jgi:hypothetical protein
MTEIRTKHLQNTNLEHCSYATVLGSLSFISSSLPLISILVSKAGIYEGSLLLVELPSQESLGCDQGRGVACILWDSTFSRQWYLDLRCSGLWRGVVGYTLQDVTTHNTTQNYWDFGHCPSSGVPETRKHSVSETGSVSVLRWVGERHLLCWVR